MRVVFADRSAGPEPLLCEVAIVFDDPEPLAGLKLVGFSLWRGTNNTVYVTFRRARLEPEPRAASSTICVQRASETREEPCRGSSS